MFLYTTGLYCPGCGGTRAFWYLLQGEIGRSIWFHPLVFYAGFVVVLELGSFAVSKLMSNPRIYIRRHLLFINIGVGIVIFNMIWKNYYLLVHGVDLLSQIG